MKADTKALIEVVNEKVERVVTIFGSKRLLITYSKNPKDNKVLIKLGSFNRFLRPIEFNFLLEAEFEEEGKSKLDERDLNYLIELIKSNAALVKDIKFFIEGIGYDWNNLPSLKDILKLQPFSEIGSMNFNYPLDSLIFTSYNQGFISKIRKALFKDNVNKFIEKKINDCINHFFHKDLVKGEQRRELNKFIKEKIIVLDYCYIFEPISLQLLTTFTKLNNWDITGMIKDKEDYYFDLRQCPLLEL